jgi:hypothetical protein
MDPTERHSFFEDKEVRFAHVNREYSLVFDRLFSGEHLNMRGMHLLGGG